MKAGVPFQDMLPYAAKVGRKQKECICQRKNHGVQTKLRTYQANHERNVNVPLEDRVLIECSLNGKSSPTAHPLYAAADFTTHRKHLTKEGIASGDNWTNVRGIFTERYAQRITKYWLQNYSPEGSLGDFFKKDYNRSEREYIIRHSGRLILKLHIEYPNMIVLKRTGKGKFGYEPVAEFDGLFHYNYGRQNHILVLETKTDDLSVDPDHVQKKVVPSLQKLYPEVHRSGGKIWYVIFGQHTKIFNGPERWGRLTEGAKNLYLKLRERDIPAFFLTFNEPSEQLNRITQRVVRQYVGAHILQNGAQKQVQFTGEVTIRHNGVDIRDGDEQPGLSFELNPATGEYRLAQNAYAQVLR